MLQYLIVLLDNTSTSFCHYRIPMSWESRLIPLNDLKKGIQFAMKENLMIQFVYPESRLPSSYYDVINSIDHIDIKPYIDMQETNTDVLVFNEMPLNLPKNVVYPNAIFRLTLQEFYDFPEYLAKEVFQSVKRMNFVIRDIDPIQAIDFKRYKRKLRDLAELVEREYIEGNSPQWNILTDRLYLSNMNNCEAGNFSITLAPNGRFYICPAFYYENMDEDVGDVYTGLSIPNPQLYKLEYAPICKHCDAWQCKRCIWMNREKTMEVNTPSHEQCVMSHLERNASREILHNLHRYGDYFPKTEIKEINYLDPFENKEQWQQENL